MFLPTLATLQITFQRCKISTNRFTSLSVPCDISFCCFLRRSNAILFNYWFLQGRNVMLTSAYFICSLYDSWNVRRSAGRVPVPFTLQWRHNDHDDVSNHQPHGCLRNRLFRRRSKKTSKFRVTGFCVMNSPGPVISPHKGPVTRKMFPFDDVIMRHALLLYRCHM